MLRWGEFWLCSNLSLSGNASRAGRPNLRDVWTRLCSRLRLRPQLFRRGNGTGKTNRSRSQGLAGQALQRGLDQRPRRRVRVSPQAVRRSVRHQAGARGGHHPAVGLHQVIPVTADAGRSCRQASAPVLQASAGEVPPVGNVGALGVGDQPAQSSQGAGMRPQVRSRGHWNRHRPWRLSDPRKILLQHLRALGAIVTVYIATASVRCKQRS